MGPMICPIANVICFSLYFATVLKALPMYQAPCSSTVDTMLGSHPGGVGVVVVSSFWEDKVKSEAQGLVLESSSKPCPPASRATGASLRAG